MIIGFTNSVDPDETAHNELSHQELRCLTFSCPALGISIFPIDLRKKKKADNKCRLKFGTERALRIWSYD